MGRSVTEVTFMAAKLKENGYRIPGHNDNVTENIIQESITEIKKIKEKTKKSQSNTVLIPETNWSQEQQRALEAAIVKYKKSANTDRWQKIANSVPGKTKEECLLRYKYLVELVKSQKETETKQEEINEKNEENEKISGVEECPVESKKQDDEIAQEEKEIDEIEEEIKKDDEEELHKNVTTKKQGKPRNKRKERKKMQEYCDSDDYSD